MVNNEFVPDNPSTAESGSSTEEPFVPQALPETPTPSKRLIPISDRTANMEAMILSFLAEHNLSFNNVPNLVSLIRTCSTDPLALAKVKLDNQTAAYKLKYGVSEYFNQTLILIANLQQCPFSMNIDEATTANNNKKVLAIWVSYFNSSKGEIVVEHFAFMELVKCDSATIFLAVMALMEKSKIPLENLQSCLMDSCSVMRGCKSGLDTRLNTVAPHLLDIDGDSCHHVHNTAKKFCEPFDNCVEKLFTDLNTDFKWSSESKSLLNELCTLFNIKFSMPERFIPHRWLSVYDVAMSTLRLYDILRVYSSADVSDFESKKTILNFIGTLKNPAAESKVHSIIALIREKNKTATKDGKERIRNKLFLHNNWTQLTLNTYVSVLGMLKKYCVLFQGKEPLVHKLHDKQMSLANKFLACFIKPEKLCDNPNKLALLDVNNVDNHVDLKECFIGKQAGIILKQCPNQVQREFLIRINKCYRQAAGHLLHKLPLTNPLIQQLYALDPDSPNHSVTTKCLNRLVCRFDHVLSTSEQEHVLIEVKDYTACHWMYCSETERIDVWWAKQSSFPALRKLALTCSTTFHGPQVGSSFSSMKDIMKIKSANMQISTFSAIQSVKYALKSRNTTAIPFFQRAEVKHTPIDPFLVQCIKSASSKYKEYLKEVREKEIKRKEQLNIQMIQLQSKKKFKLLKEKAVKRAYRVHQKSQSAKAIERPVKPPTKRQKL